MSDGDSDVSLTDSEWAVRQAGGEDGAAQQARPGRSEPATETVETGARARAQSAVKDLTSPQRTAAAASTDHASAAPLNGPSRRDDSAGAHAGHRGAGEGSASQAILDMRASLTRSFGSGFESIISPEAVTERPLHDASGARAVGSTVPAAATHGERESAHNSSKLSAINWNDTSEIVKDKIQERVISGSESTITADTFNEDVADTAATPDGSQLPTCTADELARSQREWGTWQRRGSSSSAGSARSGMLGRSERAESRINAPGYERKREKRASAISHLEDVRKRELAMRDATQRPEPADSAVSAPVNEICGNSTVNTPTSESFQSAAKLFANNPTEGGPPVQTVTRSEDGSVKSIEIAVNTCTWNDCGRKTWDGKPGYCTARHRDAADRAERTRLHVLAEAEAINTIAAAQVARDVAAEEARCAALTAVPAIAVDDLAPAHRAAPEGSAVELSAERDKMSDEKSTEYKAQAE